MSAPVITLARPADAAALGRLCLECLGYDCPSAKVAEHLCALLKDPAHLILIAQAADSAVGFVHAAHYQVLYAAPMKNILGLAVDPSFRRHGIGRALLTAVEEWARRDGCSAVRLVSGAQRSAAHIFYQSCGYVLQKEQKNFRKPL